MPGQRHHQGDRVLGGGDTVTQRRVHHHDSAPRGCLDFDVVDPYSGAADDLQLVGLLDDLRGDLGSTANDQSVVVADNGGQFGWLQTRTQIKLEFGITAKDIESLRGERIAQENSKSVSHWLSVRRRAVG